MRWTSASPRCWPPADALAAEYPGLEVHAVVSDFEESPRASAARGDGGARGWSRSSGPRSGTWRRRSGRRSSPGSASQLRPGDAFLLGTDLVKDPAVLVAAYDDTAGVTAAFNKNVLAVLNAALGADFDLDAFDHVAVVGRRGRVDRDAAALDRRPAGPAAGHRPDGDFADGEEMRTEISAKFRRDGVAAELAAAGFTLRSWWTDDGGPVRPVPVGSRLTASEFRLDMWLRLHLLFQDALLGCRIGSVGKHTLVV